MSPTIFYRMRERGRGRLRDRGWGAAKILPTFKLYTKAVDTLHVLLQFQ